MIKIFAFITTYLLATVSFAAASLVFMGKPYQVTPVESPKCGTPGGPEYTAATFILNSAQGLGEKMYTAKCQAESDSNCTSEGAKKSGIDLVFTTIRQYRSATTDAGCKELRSFCENNCKATKTYSDQDCLIECNQYETWNR
ncbi:MAG: hypothetical protein ACXWC9_07080 [Pseudobdellovibrionaceae bacterium]